MNENLKISIFVLIAFSVSFSALFSYLFLHESGNLIPYQKLEKKSLDKKFDVYLVGTSYVEVASTEFISEYLNKKGFEANVFYPTEPSDSEYLDLIEKLIANKAYMVILGVGYQDLGYGLHSAGEFVTQKTSIPEYEKTKLDTSYLLGLVDSRSSGGADQFKINNIDLSEFNPKHVTIEFLRFNFEGQKNIVVTNPENNQTIQIDVVEDGSSSIRNIDELKIAELSTSLMDFEQRDAHLDRIRSAILKLQYNNIGVLLYIPPYAQPYLDNMPNNLRIDLTDNLFKISSEFNTGFLDLSENYSTKNIFRDVTHVAEHPDASIYSKDLADIERFKPTVFQGVPPMFNLLLRHPDLSSFDISSVVLGSG